MYTFSSKLKTLSYILMALGILGIGYGFYAAPKDIQEVEKLLASESHGEHGGAKHEASASTTEHQAVSSHTDLAVDEKVGSHNVGTPANEVSVGIDDTDSIKEVNVAPLSDLTSGREKKHVLTAEEEHTEHLTHVLHQLQNKPWSAFYVACIFFMLVSLGVLAFYAIQQVAQAGWSPVLFRVMQGITAYLPVGSIIFFLFLILSGLHINHLFIWLDPEVVATDKLIANKAGYLNFPFWIFRAALFLIGWNLYRYYSRKNCLAQDDAKDNLFYKKNFKLSAMFLVFFIVTESIMSWDWIMSIDPHWFSTLFGWYVLSSFLVSAITTIALVTIYLKSKGALEHVNTSHIHDLAKFMFGFSIFWTYLWFSQYMLIWYANIPEEVTYYITRIELYKVPFFGAVVMNFVFPLLILINTDFKRISWVIVMAGVVILIGHYLDFFIMIMPGTVGDRWFIGISEIASILFFLGLFIFVVFTAMTKVPLLPKRNPFIEESKHFHY
jgi:hypothetical protein